MSKDDNTTNPDDGSTPNGTDTNDSIASHPMLDALVAQLRERHGDAVECALLYGSCLRGNNVLDGVADIYLLVSSYTKAYANPIAAAGNWLLPPNVFYAEHRDGDDVLRAKVAVMSLADFERACSTRWFQSYVWGRFAQPTHFLFCRDDDVRTTVQYCLHDCVRTLLRRSLPALAPEGSVTRMWEQALMLSYSTELRAEGSGRCAELVGAAPEFYIVLALAFTSIDPTQRSHETSANQADAGVDTDPTPTDAEANPLGFPFYLQHGEGGVAYRCEVEPAKRGLTMLAWWLRRAQGKVLSVLRLLKALFTFEGGLDYIAWKLERHSGQRVEIPERVRRHPLIFMWPFFWRLYRRGVFR